MGIRFEFLDAGNGDCIWITTDEGVNILIDGGWKYTHDKKLKKKKDRLDIDDIKTKVKKLRKNNQKLDLVILTHYDDDHILGISKLIEEEKKYKSETIIKEIWFNAFENATFPIKKKKNISSSDNQIKHKTGAKKQKEFEEFIADIKPYIDYGDLISIDEIKEPIEKENMVLLSPYTDKTYNSNRDIKITLLSPNNDKLNDCKYSDYEKNKTGKKKKERDWDKSFTDLLKNIENNEKHPNPMSYLDSSVKNGSSIAFILEYKNKKYLFLGDAHIDLISTSLVKLGFNETNNPLVVEFIKLSHHGSKANINREFLSLVQTNKFVILANGNESHWHPNKETLVLILDCYRNNDKKINFIFNYEVKKIFQDAYPIFNKKELEENGISENSFKLIYKDCVGKCK